MKGGAYSGLCFEELIKRGAYSGLCFEEPIKRGAYSGLCFEELITGGAYSGLCFEEPITGGAYSGLCFEELITVLTKHTPLNSLDLYITVLISFYEMPINETDNNKVGVTSLTKKPSMHCHTFLTTQYEDRLNFNRKLSRPQ